MFPWLPSGTRVGLLNNRVMVTACPNAFVETTVDVITDGAVSVVDPRLSVVVRKTVDWYVELEKKIASIQA